MKKKKWIVSGENPRACAELSGQLGLAPLAARVLAARGIADVPDAAAYLDCSLSHLHDPFLLAGMDDAVREVRASIERGEKIAVYGDYDVDGVTATCILIRYLRAQGAECVYYIPDRLGEGYGLNEVAIRALYEDGCRLLITVDSGITAVEEVALARALGMRVIVTDHHECKNILPQAVAVINPRREGCGYPFKELAGVGVAFKLICALERGRSMESLLEKYGDIVAVGTIADVMPLTGENRVIVTNGLNRLRQTENPGLRALIRKLGLDDKPLTSNSVSFVMAPRINAAGRLGGAAVAARLFLTCDDTEAQELAEQLCELNRMRQEAENCIYEEIKARIEAQPDLVRRKSLVLWGESWHNGVIGIVASRLCDRYGVPCVLISLSGDLAKGSGRSIKGFNLYAALEHCAPLLEKYGGHELAVGLSLSRARLEEFAEAMEDFAEHASAGEEIVPSLQIDCRLAPTELNMEEVKGLSALEPFGMGNPQPCFMMSCVTLEELTPISHDHHVKMQLSKDGRSFFAFAFGMGLRGCPYVRGDSLDIAFSAEINRYRGRESIQLVIRDIRWAENEEQCDRRSFEEYGRFADGEPLTPDCAERLSPTRDDLVAVFRHVRANAEREALCAGVRTLYRHVRYESRASMNLGRFLVCMDVFDEFSIFRYERSGDEMVIRVLPTQGKIDINGSRILRKLMDMRNA